MLKKTAYLALLASAATLCADNMNAKSAAKTTMEERYSGGFVLGGGVTTLTKSSLSGSAGGVFQVGYYDEMWLVDIGANYSNKRSKNDTFLYGHVGMRNRICGNLFVSYGAMALGEFSPGHRHHHHHKHNYGVGAFTGLDYQFTKHFLLTGKVYPYNYDHRGDRYRHNVFKNGELSLFYVF